MTDRTIAVHEILRYTKPNADDHLTHHHRNYWSIQRDPADPKAANVLQEAGINAPKLVSAPEGERMPVLSPRSSPSKSGTAGTPWDDTYRMAAGEIQYHGDHKVTSTVPLGETTGNKRLLDVWAGHRSTSPAGRRRAVPVLVFRTVGVLTGNGLRNKGFIEFCGLVVIEDLWEETLQDPTTGREFLNYAADLAVLSLGTGDRLDWRWIDARRSPWLTIDETLEHAPDAWRQWVAEGAAAMPQIRRRE